VPNSIPHSVTVDPARKLVVLTMSGVISPEDGAWMGEEVRAKVRSLGDAVGQHVTLYDFTDVPLVPQATLDQLCTTLRNPSIRYLWARKLAIVTGTTLGRLQAEKVKEVRADLELFDDRETALAWLLAD
jgi:hypothetical protein